MTKPDDNEATARLLQVRLQERGLYAGLIDGWAGPKTREALDKVLPRLAAVDAPVAQAVPARTQRTLDHLAGLNKMARTHLEAFLSAAEVAMVKHGVRVEVISGLRSWQQQADLYAQGRTKPGKIVTNAQAGSSWHQYGLAMDLGLFRGGVYLDGDEPKLAAQLYAELGKIATAMGIEWAGTWKSFPEGPHFQWTNGLTLAVAKQRMEALNYDHQAIFA